MAKTAKGGPKRAGREQSRDVAMRLLYQLSVGGEGDLQAFVEQVEDVTLDSDDEAYINDILNGVKTNSEHIDSLIEQHAIDWKLSRMSKVDIAILRLAIYEIVFRDDIPISVSANEAVDLAQLYSGEKSAKFVNGLLGQVIKTNEETGS